MSNLDRTREIQRERAERRTAAQYRARDPIAERLARHGYVLEHTGGNCTAYVRHQGETRVVITDYGCSSAPDDLDDSVEVGVYHGPGHGAASMIETTLGAYLTLLDAHAQGSP